MYREDDVARAARARALIDEIAGLERDKLARAELDQRLDDARRELASLQEAGAPPGRGAGWGAHLLAFGAAAVAAFAGYTLLM